MKAVFGIFALFLVAANAGVIEQPINLDLVTGIINEGKHAAVVAVHEIEHQIEEIVHDSLHEVEEALESIEKRIEEDEACVIAQNAHVEAVVDDMYSEITHCGVVAAHDSADIATDVAKASQQLVFDGYDVLTTFKKCRNTKNSILKKTCQASLAIKVSLYTINARRSIKTIKAAPERVPVVFSDADVCTHNASEHAVSELEAVHKDIDACIQKY